MLWPLPQVQPQPALCKLLQLVLSASLPSAGSAAFAACNAYENTRDDTNFPGDFAHQISPGGINEKKPCEESWEPAPGKYVLAQ